jgi:hypothetical protein
VLSILARQVQRELCVAESPVSAARYGADTTVPDWGKRLVCGQCGSRNVSFIVSGTKHEALNA